MDTSCATFTNAGECENRLSSKWQSDTLSISISYFAGVFCSHICEEIFKVPLLWVMKGSYFGFGSPRHICIYNNNYNAIIICIYFLPYLLNDSQTIHLTIDFSKPLLCVTLIWGDWSDWSHFHCIVAVLHIQRYRGNRYFYHSKSCI